MGEKLRTGEYTALLTAFDRVPLFHTVIDSWQKLIHGGKKENVPEDPEQFLASFKDKVFLQKPCGIWPTIQDISIHCQVLGDDEDTLYIQLIPTNETIQVHVIFDYDNNIQELKVNGRVINKKTNEFLQTISLLSVILHQVTQTLR